METRKLLVKKHVKMFLYWKSSLTFWSVQIFLSSRLKISWQGGMSMGSWVCPSVASNAATASMKCWLQFCTAFPTEASIALWAATSQAIADIVDKFGEKNVFMHSVQGMIKMVIKMHFDNFHYTRSLLETLHNERCIFNCIAFFTMPPPVVA